MPLGCQYKQTYLVQLVRILVMQGSLAHGKTREPSVIAVSCHLDIILGDRYNMPMMDLVTTTRPCSTILTEV